MLFAASETSNAELTERIEAMLAEAFDYVPTVVVRSRKQMGAIVAGAPKGFGAAPATYRYDVIFLKEPLTAKTALKSVPTNPAVDAAHAGPASSTSRGSPRRPRRAGWARSSRRRSTRA